MQFTDRLTLDGGIRRQDGYAIAQARVARAGNVQLYAGAEVGRPEMDVVRVFRPEEEVFDRASISTYARRPVTVGHPENGVSEETWKRDAVGEIDRDVVRDGEFVSVPLIIRDAEAIKAVETGTNQLSMGYDAALVWGDGVSPSGEAYDAKQTSLRMNHVAIVDAARGGKELRIGDGASDGGKDRATWGIAPLNHDHKPKGPDMTMSTVVLGDKAVQVAASDAPAIEAFKADAAAKLGDAEKKNSEAIAAKDKELAEKDAKIAELEKKVLDDAALDKRVQDRAALVAKATSIAKDVKTEGVSDADIRKAVVIAKRGEDAVKDKSAVYIDAAFDLLTEDDGGNRSDPVHDAIRTKDHTASNDAWSDSVFQSAGVTVKKGA